MSGPVQRRLTKSFLPHNKIVLPAPGTCCLWNNDSQTQQDLDIICAVNNVETGEIYLASKDVPQQVAHDFQVSADLLESENAADVPHDLLVDATKTKVYKTKQKLNWLVATIRMSSSGVKDVSSGKTLATVSWPYKLFFVRDAYGGLNVHASNYSGTSSRWSYQGIPAKSDIRIVPKAAPSTDIATASPLSVPVIMAPDVHEEVVLFLT